MFLLMIESLIQFCVLEWGCMGAWHSVTYGLWNFSAGGGGGGGRGGACIFMGHKLWSKLGVSNPGGGGYAPNKVYGGVPLNDG